MEQFAGTLPFIDIQNEFLFLRRMAVGMIMIGSITFLALLFLNAPYGRYASPSWGPVIEGRIGWIMQELPSLAIPIYLLLATDCQTLSNTSNKIIVLMYTLHYIQRTLIFPLLIRGGKQSPLLTVGLAFFFCLCNGYMQGRYHTSYAIQPRNLHTEPVFLIGVSLFAVGMIINIHSDHILRNLRKPGETGYKIPKGGLFDYVSGANFLGEIIEWSGYALAAGTLPAFAFVFYTVCNIGPRAWHHHRWYIEKFGAEYPSSRKALIPFLL